MAIENLFHAANVRSALKLGHARGVAMLAAVEAGCEVVEYTPAEIKRAVVGYGRAEKHQVQQMVKLLLGLDEPPSPHDAADALAVAICHVHSDARRPAAATALATIGAPRRPPGAGARTVRPRARGAPRPGARTGRRRRMIAFLRGRVLEKQPNRSSSTCTGVGYDVHVPLSTYYDIGERAPRSRCASTRTCARTRCSCTASSPTLERQLFERLIGISGIGPKLAIAVLSGIEAARARGAPCSAATSRG